jgi:hypothetical protein
MLRKEGGPCRILILLSLLPSGKPEGRESMTTLYRGPRGLVTHDVIATADTNWRPVPFASLSDVHIVRTGSVHRPVVPRVFGVGALAIAVAAIPVRGVPAIVVAMLLATVALVDVLSSRKDSVRWELVAHRAARRCVLFRSLDQREFDQLCRAVQRALEAHGDDQPHSR